MALYNRSLFIFRRDLRLEDNTALIAALTHSKAVIPCFIFDPRQIAPNNSFRSLHAIQFMIESLKDLKQSLEKQQARLYLFFGIAEQIVDNLLREIPIDALYVNKDYTPFSQQRDAAMESLCAKYNKSFHSFDDLLIHSPDSIINKQGEPYRVFTAFYKVAGQLPVKKPNPNHYTNYYTQAISFEEKDIFRKLIPQFNADLYVHGGRQKAAQIITHLDQFADYNQTRNFPAIDTTGLSAHNKFGTYSIREVYYKILKNLGSRNELIKQLYWRDFFTYIAYHWPKVFGNPFHEKFSDLDWSYNKHAFDRWCGGTTGFPIVDAGMRQLNQTGFMHNRVRLIVGSFLTKDLHIDWQWGEKYFAQQLTDYDPSVNNGNWQWVASTGCDAQPYFRIFNPWLQQAKFDPNCAYIKKWVPELRDVPVKTILTWFKQTQAINNYSPPMLDHQKQAAITKQLYQRAATKK